MVDAVFAAKGRFCGAVAVGVGGRLRLRRFAVIVALGGPFCAAGRNALGWAADPLRVADGNAGGVGKPCAGAVCYTPLKAYALVDVGRPSGRL